MTNEELSAIQIGEELPIPTARALPREHKVVGVPEWIRVRVHCGEQGWYFSSHGSEDRHLPYRPAPALAGQFFSSRDELLTALRQYLSAADPERPK